MQLQKHLLPLQQQVSTYGTSALLFFLSSNRIQELEEASRTDDVIKRYIEILKMVSAKAIAEPDEVQHQIELKEVFSEALMYVRLGTKGTIERVKEDKNEKRPDFKFSCNGSSCYIEVKALNMTGGAQTHEAIQKEGLEGKASLEGELREGKKQVVFSEQVIQPYAAAGGEKYDTHSTRLVIETLIKKVEQNLKQEQFKQGDTVLLIDLCEQLLLHDSVEKHSQETFVEADTNNRVSGELWHLAFGVAGKAITKHISFDGECNEDGELSVGGILKAHDFIKALIVHADDKFYGFVINSNTSAAVNAALNAICERAERI